jgi:hypothetical protein
MHPTETHSSVSNALVPAKRRDKATLSCMMFPHSKGVVPRGMDTTEAMIPSAGIYFP